MSLPLADLIDALSILGELSAAVPHTLERQLPPRVQDAWPFLDRFVVVGEDARSTRRAKSRLSIAPSRACR